MRALLLLAFLPIACSSASSPAPFAAGEEADAGPDSAASGECSPGDTVVCECDDRPVGFRKCDKAASVWGACLCPDAGPKRDSEAPDASTPPIDSSSQIEDAQAVDAANDVTPDAALEDAAVDACQGGRFVVLDPGTKCNNGDGLVLDTKTKLKWQRNTWPQDRGDNATARCVLKGMRIPTVSEALGIVGADSCAFPCQWETWAKPGDESKECWEVRAYGYKGKVDCTAKVQSLCVTSK